MSSLGQGLNHAIRNGRYREGLLYQRPERFGRQRPVDPEWRPLSARAAAFGAAALLRCRPWPVPRLGDCAHTLNGEHQMICSFRTN